jgi:hypothetical protein
MATRKIDDAQPSKSEANGPVVVDKPAIVVRPTMTNGVCHGEKQILLNVATD